MVESKTPITLVDIDNHPTAIVRVGNNSIVKQVAGYVANLVIERDVPIQVQAVGIVATHKAVMAITHANRFLSENGISISFWNTYKESNTKKGVNMFDFNIVKNEIPQNS